MTIECAICDGRGERWNGRGTGHANDPDSYDVECEACNGLGHLPCPVCGFNIDIPGYDCFPCEVVRELGTKDAFIDFYRSLPFAFEGYSRKNFRPVPSKPDAPI